MTRIRVSGDKTVQALRQLSEAVNEAAAKLVVVTGEAMAQHAKDTTKFRDRSHDTRDSIQFKLRGPRRGFVRAGGHAKFLEDGTKAHRIEAKGKALRFEVAGTAIYRRWVSHPGTKATHFMRDARDFGERTAETAAAFIFGQALK